MKTSIIILTKNNIEYTKLCIDSIRRYTEYGTYEIIVVDNGSHDGTTTWLNDQTDLILIYNTSNQGFPRGCNQGISVANGDQILLLNNDVIVTENWLVNLLECLYSSDYIGAVGPVSNVVSYYQSISTQYRNLDEMHAFAAGFNSEPMSIEFRIRLIGFCMLIRRDVVVHVGGLDERFSPGNFEDDDYSMRILGAGYRMGLSRNTFVHHFGSASFKQDVPVFNHLLEVNRQKFYEKWGFDSSNSTQIHFELLDLIDEAPDKPFRVLDVNCGCGATLLQIKNKFSEAELHGLDENSSSIDIAKSFCHASVGSVEMIQVFPDDYFDYIIAPNVLPYVQNPKALLQQFAQKLRLNGMILLSVPNIAHYRVIRNLLNGRWSHDNFEDLGREQIHFFTVMDLQQLLELTGFKISIVHGTMLQIPQEEQPWLQQLQAIASPAIAAQLNAYQLQVKAACNKTTN